MTGLPARADVGREVFIEGHESVTAVHDEAKGHGLVHRRLHLAENFGFETAQSFRTFSGDMVLIESYPAGIDQGKGPVRSGCGQCLPSGRELRPGGHA